MLLRSISNHAGIRSPAAIAVDFVSLVAGVFMGIQVSNWNEDRQNAQLAAGYVERIQVEIEDEFERWGHFSEYYETVRRHGIAALDAYSTPADQLDSQFLIDLFQASQRISLLSSRATYDELLSTGRLAYIPSASVRRQLAIYYRRVDALDVAVNEIDPYRRIVRLYMDHNIQNQILENCGDVYDQTEKLFYLRLPDTCEIDVQPELLSSEITKLHRNLDVQRELRFHLSVERSRLGALKNAQGVSRVTLEYLKTMDERN